MTCLRHVANQAYLPWIKPIVLPQKSAAHAAVDDVVAGRVGQRDEGGARPGHVMRTNAFAASPSRHHSSVSANPCRSL